MWKTWPAMDIYKPTAKRWKGCAAVVDIGLLLDNADYEIRFAESLGYGKKDKEFEELYDASRQAISFRSLTAFFSMNQDT
jgi:hypothetical protein